MAVFGTASVTYGPILDAAIKSDGGILSHLNQPRIGNPQAAAISVPIKTAVAAMGSAASSGNITDGTMLANASARTLTALTGYSMVYPVSLLPYQKAAYDAAEDAAEFRAFLDGARRTAEREVVLDLVGGTASTIGTLAAGQLNFTYTTEATRLAAMALVDQVLAGVVANTATDSGRIFGITTKTGFGNLWGMIANSQFGQYIANPNGQDQLIWRGHPIYQFNETASGYGAAANADAFYWVHPNAEAFTWTGAYSPFGEPQHEADGTYKKYFHADFFAGLIQSTHYGTIVNGTS